MRLILTKEQYLLLNPVYGFQVPEYLKKILNVSESQYFQSGMEQTQRIINAYLQDFLLNLDWDISSLDGNLQEKIKEILFLEFQYLHENQIWFEKSNDITYSTAGQQTFTFNTNLSEKEGVKLIPDYVIKIIKNSGILKFAAGLVELQTKASFAENQFKDGYFVPEVEWNSKANNFMSASGNNITLEQAIINLQNNTINNNDSRFLKSAELVENVSITQNSLNWSKLLKSDNFYPNKQVNDYAQIQDLQNLWNGSNQLIQNNTIAIQNNTENIQNLETNKVNVNDLQSYLSGKADNDFSNVQLSKRNVNQFIMVDIDGKLYYTNASGNLSATVWQYDKEYFNGDAVYVEEAGVAVIYLAKNVVGNIGKNPPISPDFWIKYQADFDLSNYLTAGQSRAEFFPKIGGELNGNLDMTGHSITNVSNLIDNARINDTITTTTDLWSSAQTQAAINEQALILSKVENQKVTGTIDFKNDITFDKSLSIINNNVGGKFSAIDNGNLNLELNNQAAKFTVNGEAVVTNLNNVAFTNIENTFTTNQIFNKIDASNLTATTSNLNSANIENLTVSENIEANHINATSAISVNGSELATQDSLNNAINQVYDNLSQYNITTWEGVWRSTTRYNKGAMVKYELNGLFYLSNISDNIGNNPTTTPEYWTQTSGELNVDLSNYVTVNTQQDVTAKKNIVISNGGEMMTFKTSSRQSKHLGFWNGGGRMGFIGQVTDNSNDFTINSVNGAIVLSSSTGVSINNKKIVNLADPVNNNDAANKNYVDTQITTIANKSKQSIWIIARCQVDGLAENAVKEISTLEYWNWKQNSWQYISISSFSDFGISGPIPLQINFMGSSEGYYSPPELFNILKNDWSICYVKPVVNSRLGQPVLYPEYDPILILKNIDTTYMKQYAFFWIEVGALDWIKRAY